MSETQWYIEREGVEYGPCNWDGLQALARQGTLQMTDLVRREGDTYWVPAHSARCDAAANPAMAAAADAARAQSAPRTLPAVQRKQIIELAGPAKARAQDDIERAVEEDLQ